MFGTSNHSYVFSGPACLQARHAMHVVFVCPTTGAAVWLGGIGASGQANVLVKNGVAGILAAAANPPPARDCRLEDLGTFDGTGLVQGSVSLKALLGRFKRVLALLTQGKSILISCRNGAHRSSTIAVLLLVWLTGESAQLVAEYLGLLRNIVDLESIHPGDARRGVRTGQTPLEWLVGIESVVLADRTQCGSPFFTTLSLSQVLEPQEWEARACSMGFKKIQDMVWLNVLF